MPILGFHGTRFENDCSKVCRVVQWDEKQGQRQVFQGGEQRACRQVAQVSTRAGHGEGREARRFGSCEGPGWGGFSPVSPPLRLASIAPRLRYVGAASLVLSSKATLPILICWAVLAGCVGRAFQSSQMTVWAANCQASLWPLFGPSPSSHSPLPW